MYPHHYVPAGAYGWMPSPPPQQWQPAVVPPRPAPPTPSTYYADSRERWEQRFARLYLADGYGVVPDVCCYGVKVIFFPLAALINGFARFLWSWTGMAFLFFMVLLVGGVGWVEYSTPGAAKTAASRGGFFQTCTSLIVITLLIVCVVKLVLSSTCSCLLSIFRCFTCCCRNCGCDSCLEGIEESLCENFRKRKQPPAYWPPQQQYIYNPPPPPGYGPYYPH